MLRTVSTAAICAACLAFAACSGGTVMDAPGSLSTGDVFKVVRFNENGMRDTALDGTVELTSRTEGNTTAVTIAVNDAMPMYGVALDLTYDDGEYNPVDVDFSGLVSEPIELAASHIGGLVALAQASTLGKAQRSGEFATVVFRHEPAPPARMASAPHSLPVNTQYAPSQLASGQDGFEITKSLADNDSPAAFTIYSIFAAGDGDDNGETNASDITPMIAQGNFGNAVAAGNFGPAATDYDMNGEVNISDITPIVLQLNHVLGGVEILLGDSATLTAANLFRSRTYADATPSNRTLNNPFSTTNWSFVFRTWSEEITAAEMEAVDANDDGTVYVSAMASDGTNTGTPFTGLPLTYDTGPAAVTSIDLSFPGSDTWPTDGSGNFIVLITEESVDDTAGNSQLFAPEFLDLVATVDTTDETGIDGTELVVWSLTEGSGLAAVDDTAGSKGHLTFDNRGRVVIEAHAIESFTTVTDEISFVLCSIDSLALTETGGAPSPFSVDSGTTVQFAVTGSFDWDGLDNGNEVEEDLTTYCRWAGLPGGTNTGLFNLRTDLGAVETDNADSGDSIRVVCEFGEDGGVLYDNLSRSSELFEVVIN